MKKIKEALHLGHSNVPPSAAQSSAAPAPVTGATTSTQPGTGLGLSTPAATSAPMGTGATGLAPSATGMGTGMGTGATGLAPSATGMGTGLGTGLGTGMGTGLAPSATGMGPGLGTSAPLSTTSASTGYTSSGAGYTSSGAGYTSSGAGYGQGMGTAAPLSSGVGYGGMTTTTSVSQGTILEREVRVIDEERVISPRVERKEEFVSAPVTHLHSEPAVIEHKERAPVVQEVIKPGVREEIQPVIHREREQLEIREELLPIYEKSVRPTLVEERELAAEYRPEVRTGVMPVIAEGPRESVSVETEHRETIMNAPIIEETVHRKIIEEVQPVIHRETIAPKIIREVKPIYEKVVEAPVVTYETLPARYATATVAAPAPPQMVEQQVVTTTTVEREFIPGSSGAALTGARSGTSAPLTSTGATTSTLGAAPYSSTGTPSSSSLGAQPPVTQFKELKLEETTQPSSFQQAPSTFQRY